MIKRIGQVALGSLILCCMMCGCSSGKDEVLLIGEENLSASSEKTKDIETGLQEPEAEILVYVCGAVKNPGVVSLREGGRAADALEAAGGFAENAATDYVNLAEKVSDGEKLYFPDKEECEAVLQTEDNGGKLININTADAATLCTLPGIGEARATDIIRYRETFGPFESCEDIMKVSGIKTSVYNKIHDMITVK